MWSLFLRINAVNLFKDFLKTLQVGADFWAGPVLCADELAPDDALAIDDIGLWPHGGVEKIGCSLVRVANGDQVNMTADEKAIVSAWVFVGADSQNDEIGLSVVEFEQRWHLQNAGLAPCCPEVEQHHVAAIGGKMNRRCSVRNSEVRGYAAGLRGMHAAIAGGHEAQRQKKEEDKEATKSHILIIRSKIARMEGLT